MKINVTSLLAGICIAISGSIFASSVSVPYIFTSGQKAKASEINTNFSALAEAVNELSGKVSIVENNVSTVSDFVGATTKEIVPISQIDLPVGSKFIVHGIEYTIVQFEFPRFDTDETYLIKYPTSQNVLNEYFSESIRIFGHYPDDLFDGYGQERIATISGFPATLSEGFSFNNSVDIYNKNRSTKAEFNHSSGATIIISSDTYLSIGFYFSQKSNANSKIISTDTTDISHAYPITMTQPNRAQLRSDFRTLLNYVVIHKKE